MTTEPMFTPPPELVKEWASAFYGTTIAPGEAAIDIATQAARWGADQELEACYQWVTHELERPGAAICLREERRPKPPSLKETLLARVARIPGEGADAAYLRHWVDNESQRLVDLLHEVFKSLPD